MLILCCVLSSAITGRGGPLGRRLRSERYNLLVPLLWTGVRHHPPGGAGGPTRTSADVSVPRLPGLPDHLITFPYNI